MILYGNFSKKKLIYEKVPIHPSVSLTVETFRDKVFDSSWHYHPEMELTYIVEGSGQILIGSEWMTFSPGHLALIGGNTPHLYVSVPVSGEYSEFRVIRFSPVFAESLLDLPEFEDVRTLFETASAAIVIRNFQEKKIFDRIRYSSGAEQVLHVMELLLSMSKLPMHVVESADEGGKKRTYESDVPELDKAIRYLQLNFTKPITLADTARAAGMSEEGFRRFFKRHVFITFTDYLLELRLTLARKLLRESSKSISEIAELSGFRNLSNFNRHFRTRQRQSPREYRCMEKKIAARL